MHPKQNNHTKMSNINSTRYNWVDWCKSIAIFLVIWGHLPMHSIAISIIYSFHMPLFFLISGYLYKPQKTAKEEFKKNFKTLFVPYLIYQLIFYPYWMVRESLVFHQSFTIYDSIIRPIIQSLASNAINGPTWFIYCLLSFKIYAYCIQKKQSLSVPLTCFSCILSILICFWLNNRSLYVTYAIHHFFTLIIFFFAGQALKHINLKYISDSLYKSIIWLSFFTIIFGTLIRTGYNSNYTTLLESVKFYILGFTGSGMILGIGFILNRINSKIIYNISIGTMVILGIHWMLIGVLNFSIEKYLHLSEDISYSTSTAFFISGTITIIMYPMILFCKKHLPILLGKGFSSNKYRKLINSPSA